MPPNTSTTKTPKTIPSAMAVMLECTGVGVEVGLEVAEAVVVVYAGNDTVGALEEGTLMDWVAAASARLLIST